MTKDFKNLRKEYERAFLDETKVNSDPFLQFDLWFTEALQANVDEPNAMVLSTANLSGEVSARVVLLKGLELGMFTFFTHYGSRKGIVLAENPRAALTFHWKEVERQVRVEGIVTRISRAASRAYFSSRPRDSRISAMISPQSCRIPDRAFLEALRKGALLDLGDKEPECPPDWGGYQLKPGLIEFWQGREHRLHDRIVYKRKGNAWTIERLAP